MDINNVGIIGAGFMGTGIAHVFAQANFKVNLNDVSKEIIENSLRRIKKELEKGVNKRKITDDDMNRVLNNITITDDINEAAKDADIIVEAVIENIEVKKDVFRKLDGICKPHTIFASNTTALSISEMASATKRADKFIGMHFFSPAQIMKLVEVIKGINTSEETFNTVLELAKKLGKNPIGVNESPGFIVTRILAPMVNEAFYALMEGVASAEDIDNAMKMGMNLPMGPLELTDFMGLDIGLAAMETLYREFGDSKYRPCPLLRKYVRAGRLGVKTGKGVYEYPRK
jgi:3-hydroxybutyryl-CoA dehydrogenase